MKKIIRMLICVQLLLVLIAQTVFAQDTGKGADIQSKKNYLIEKGYDEEILSYLSDDNINSDIVNIGLHFILKNVRPYAAPCSEA